MRRFKGPVMKTDMAVGFGYLQGGKKGTWFSCSCVC